MFKISSVFMCAVAACLLASTAMAKDYKCPEKIKIDHQKGLVGDFKKGTYRYNKIAVRPDARLFKTGDWDRFVTLDSGKHRGWCQVSTRIEGFGEINTLICECADKANNITFSAAKSVVGAACKTKGKLAFSCK